ncbi:MAG: PD-(D/E)XK nuclease family protein [Nanoarchaeota archaeon]|nr:PD-(D/E)XK nuclease family protein [Nanoarchaeota archaeon]
MPYKLSPSSLCVLEDCPRCFWLRFKKNINRPRGIFPSLPSGMDKILKAHFDRFRDTGTLPPELVSEGVKAKLFDDIELLKVWQSNFKGISWTDSKGNILRGAVDNILVKGKKLIVLDYKTRGYALKEDTAAHYQHQLDIYNFLLRKNGWKTEDYGYLLFYVPDKVTKTGEVLFDTDLVKMEISVKNAESIFKRALKVLNGKMPKASENCEYCGYCEKKK